VTEFRIRTVAPAVVIVIEQEGPTRMFSTAGSPEDEGLEAWLRASPFRAAAVAAGLADRRLTGGVARATAWTQVLAERHEDRFTALVERLIADDG
jgi:hypothetical protein